MTNLKIRIATAIATGTVLVGAVAPAFAATDITISGNGRDSDSTAAVSTTNTTTVAQTNVANINNNTTVNSNTGNNKANDNIGGDVTVKSGSATSGVTVQNNANTNVANVADCGCNNGGSVEVSGNGRGSSNTVGLTQVNATGVAQTNVANVNNNTVVNSNTGHNKANDNLGGQSGDGDVEVTSGPVNTSVNVGTAVNSNVAQIGGGSTSMGDGVSAKILGNGRDSDNDIALSLVNSASVAQTNTANVNNNTVVNSDTGFNRANDNLGGDVTVESGKAKSDINVDTAANFNAAALAACGCDMTVTAKIADNLRDSDNSISASLSNAQAAFQTSVLNGNNNTVDNSETGHNKANDNGGAVNLSDPHVQSGPADATVTVGTSGNTNTVGTGVTVPMPGNNSVNFSFNWNQFWAQWMAWMSI
jgi:hypothetical protein